MPLNNGPMERIILGIFLQEQWCLTKSSVVIVKGDPVEELQKL